MTTPTSMEMNSTASTKRGRPYLKAFACGAILLLVLTVLLSVGQGHFSARGFGRLTFSTLFPAGLVGFIASRSRVPWSTKKLIGIYLGVFVGLLLVGSGVLTRSA